jgi:flagellar motor switch protein FliG
VTTMARQELSEGRSHGRPPRAERAARQVDEAVETAPASTASWGTAGTVATDAIDPVRKAAIVLVSLEQSLASQLLSHLDRSAVEAVTWEIARLERVLPEEREAVLEEFYGLGLRRLSFVFDDIIKMNDSDVRAAFHEEDVETWALALAGAAAPARAKVLAALSSALAQRLRRHLDHLGPFRLSDAEAAQLEVAERLRRLYDRGRISLPEPSGHDEVLV